jgi:Zn-finger nucleic acid-binding protein
MHRYDVEVDLCPTCNGAWLNRGEIDEIASIQTPYVGKFNKKIDICIRKMIMMVAMFIIKNVRSLHS